MQIATQGQELQNAHGTGSQSCTRNSAALTSAGVDCHVCNPNMQSANNRAPRIILMTIPLCLAVMTPVSIDLR